MYPEAHPHPNPPPEGEGIVGTVGDGDVGQGDGVAAAEVEAVVRELAWAFQESVVDVVSAKLVEMARRYGVKGLVLGGGVTANARLREEILRRSPLPVIIPPPALCTDNGAMVAACAYYQLQRGEEWPLDLDVAPGLPLG